MNNNDEKFLEDYKLKSNEDEINIIKENPIISVFNKEALLYIISTFLTFEEIKTFYSINKKVNTIFRNNIKQIKTKHLLKNPEIVKRFPNLKIFNIFKTNSFDLNILKEKEFKGLEALTIKEVETKNDIIEIISQFTGLKNLY